MPQVDKEGLEAVKKIFPSIDWNNKEMYDLIIELIERVLKEETEWLQGELTKGRKQYDVFEELMSNLATYRAIALFLQTQMSTS